MYYAFIENGKLNGAGQARILTAGWQNVEISQEVYENIKLYTYKDGEIVLDDTHTFEKEQVRAVRNEYLEIYVDWYQSKPLLWEELTEGEKEDIANYRQYLKDYTSIDLWWERNPKTFEEWKQ